MSDIHVSLENLSQFMAHCQNQIDEHRQIVVSIQSADTGKWSMARLWRKWMEITAAEMSRRGSDMPLMITADGKRYGSRPFNSSDAHELFTVKWLGTGQDGTRLSWARKGHDGMRAASKGERFNALRQHEDWCSEKGIMLVKPRESEYVRMEKEQNGNG